MNLIPLGCINSPHGLKGELNVHSYSLDPKIFFSLSLCYLKSPYQRSFSYRIPLFSSYSYKIMRRFFKGRKLVIKLVGIDDRTQASNMRGLEICVPRKFFPELPFGEYYWVDLVGCAFYGDLDGCPTYIGLVKEILDNGAHVLLKIVSENSKLADNLYKSSSKSKNQKDYSEILVPFVSTYITSVDIVSRRIDSNWSVYY